MNEPQRSEHFPFTHWTNSADRSCWTCAHAIGHDGVQLWCERFRIVVIDARSCWERGAGSTSLNDRRQNRSFRNQHICIRGALICLKSHSSSGDRFLFCRFAVVDKRRRRQQR